MTRETNSNANLQLGYLIPTREQIMRGDPGVRELIDSAKYAVGLGVDSLWVGDSLTARPRHDPLTLLGGLATVVPEVTLGTAVLLPALRNPVLLAQQLATLDQLAEGRLVVGAGIAADAPAIHAEFAAAGVPFEKRVGRFMEGFRLMRELWLGEPVDWDGRWLLQAQSVAPTTYQPQGPPVWLGTASPAGLKRCAQHFDGWFPIGPDVKTFAERKQQLLAHRSDPSLGQRAGQSITTAIYLTIAIMSNADVANQAIDDYLESYYGAPAAIMRSVQACCGGRLGEVVEFLRAYQQAGADHIILRVVGDHKATLSAIHAVRDELN